MVESILNFVNEHGVWGIVMVFTVLAMVLLFKWGTKKLSKDIGGGMETLATNVTNNMNNLTKSMTDHMIELNENMSENLTTLSNLMTNSMSKQNDALIASMTQQNKELVNLIRQQSEVGQSQIKNHKIMLNERMKVTSKINDKVRNLMNLANCDRVMILEFHNTNENLNGIPFAKYSCTHEYFRRGISQLANKCVNMQFYSISSVIMDMLNKETEQIYYEDIETIAEVNPTLYSLLVECKAKSILFTGIYDNKNCLIGLISLEYHERMDEKLIDFEEIRTQADIISSMINLKNDKNE